MPPRPHISATRVIAVRLGEINLNWNALQQWLGVLFQSLVDRGCATPLWHSATSDRTQRNMLRVVTKHLVRTKEITKEHAEDILWLLKQGDFFSDHRNDATHTPFMLTHSQGKLELKPLEAFGHPRAGKLAAKDLKPELEWYRDVISSLSGYAMRMAVHKMTVNSEMP